MTTTLTKLPTYDTAFIGRDRAELALLELFGDSELRLLTLVGASGSGKTRLSLHVAAQLADQFPGGCVFVALAPVTDPHLVLTTIAHSLDLSEQGSSSVLEALNQALRNRRMLLILDNFEQVLAAASDIQTLIEHNPQLRIVVTSQVPLNVPSEVTYQVPPLAIPPSGVSDLDVLQSYSALALFIDRIRQVQPQFAMSAENSAAIVTICQLVEGLPLAIELIAAHSAALTPQDLLLFLERHLRLGKLQPGLNSRQRIIQPVLDWCVSRLEPEQRELFYRLGVFVGGWVLESAQTVCNVRDDLGLDLVEGMEVLRAKHLIQVETLWGQDQRYIMLDTVHEYTQRHLRIRRKLHTLAADHAAYFAQLAHDAYAARSGEDQVVWLQRLSDEYHNIRAMLHWREHNRSVADLAESAHHLAFFWKLRGYLHEGRVWLMRVLNQARALTPMLAAALYHDLGELYVDLADFKTAAHTFEQGLALARQSGDLAAQARLLNGLGKVAGYSGQIDTAIEYFTQNLALYRELNDVVGIERTLSNLALCWSEQGKYEQAISANQESLAMAEERGNTFSLSITLTNLGQLYWLLGDFVQAVDATTRALELAEALGDQYGIVLTRINLADIAGREGEYERALGYVRSAIQLARETGLYAQLAQGLLTLVFIHMLQGELAAAKQVIVEPLAIIEEHGIKPMIPDLTEQYVRIAIADERWEQAARLLGFAAAQRQAVGSAAGPTQQQDTMELMAAVRTHVADERWEQLYSTGATLELAALRAAA